MKRTAFFVITTSILFCASAVDAQQSPRRRTQAEAITVAGSYQWLANEFCGFPEASAYASSIVTPGVNGAPVIVPTRDFNPRYIVFHREWADFTRNPEGLTFSTYTDPNQALYAYNNTQQHNKGYVTMANAEIIVWVQNGAYPCQ